MKVLSFRDLMVCEELSHIKNEIELLHPSNDALVNSLLVQIGFDTKKNILYEASKHRDLKGHVAIGFCACGEYSTDPQYRKFLDVTERTVVAGMTDPSLGREMAAMQGRKNVYRNDEDKWDDGSRAKADDPRYFSEAQLLEFGYTMGDPEDELDDGYYIEASWEEDLRAIKQLESVHDAIRKGV
jgi:hypothetical protein